ncbi:tetratricopeptide repeat protein [Sediminitomix flava]|uniref:Tetratricopeptide repeat protein n=1 Tax=Sediminitomix flava TaxID=379075 RepID=A0A315Z7M2_SEDFL|nr:tetratricopeptide repeat protein [Sediminitomix flava]PWJ40962.1 tetratricopeptide repeat protein [Sediminitomix flava]
MRFFWGVLIVFLPSWVLGAEQSTEETILKMDSLEAQLEGVESDSIRMNHLFQLTGFYLNRDIDKAHLFIKQASLLTEKMSPSLELSKYYHQYGNVFYMQGFFLKAADYYMRAANIAQKIGDVERMVNAYNNIGMVYVEEGNIEKAEHYLEKALKLSEEIDPEIIKRVKFYMTMNLGIISHQKQKNNAALLHYERALSEAQEYGDKAIEASILHNIGKVFVDEDKYDQALVYFEKAYELKQSIGDLKGTITPLLEISTIYSKGGKYKDALKAIKEADAVAEHYGSTDMKTYVDSGYYEVYSQMNETAKALSYLEAYVTKKSQIDTEQKAQDISRLINQHKIEINNLEYEAEKQKQRAQTRMIVGTLVFLLVIFLMLYLLQRSKTKQAFLAKEKARLAEDQLRLENDALNQSLEYKNKELTTNIMNLIQKNQLINQVSNDLIGIQSDLKEANKRPIRKMIYSLQSSSSDEIWKEFEIQFQQVHTEFYQRLHERYPDLSANERKLCAFLLLNMSTKDISSITQQQPRTINVARFRLRKKLGLTGSDTDLHAFLASI